MLTCKTTCAHTYSARQYGDISSRGALAATTYKNFRPFAHPAAGSSCKFVLARLSHNLCTDYTKKVFTFYCHALRLKPVHDNKKVNAEPLMKARSQRRPTDANMLTNLSGVISCVRAVIGKPNGVIKAEMEKLSWSNFGATKTNGVIYSAVLNI